MHLRPLQWLPLPFCLALAGCPSGSALSDPDRFNEACDALPIFEQNCAGSLCHSSEDGEPPSGTVDLLAPDLPARLIGVSATYAGIDDASACPETPELLVDPAAPERSLLLTKLLGTQACGQAMPIPNPPSALDEASIRCIRSYIYGILESAGTGGASGSGGSASGGGSGTGGAATGGAATGGDASTGGGASGGAANTGGSATGGAEGAQ